MSRPRRPLVAGNWKLHHGVSESVSLARRLRRMLASERDAEVVLAPVFTAIASVADALKGSPLRIAAQNAYWEDRGAFTGEVSAPLLKEAGCSYCIVGHSERRQLFGESDDTVNRRIHALLGPGLHPILCVGEVLAEREEGRTSPVVLGQLEAGLAGLANEELAGLVVAYEPVWAIGTGRTASPGDAQEVHAAIRRRIAERFSERVATATRILYGGSVKPDNAMALLAQRDIDGALVGGASLRAESFAAIVEAAG